MRIYTYQRGKARIRGPYWLVFLLRYAGARISKAINIQYDDIDFRNAEIKLTILKRHNKSRKKKELGVRSSFLTDSLKIENKLKLSRMKT